MGCSLARAALAAGHKVTLISASVDRRIPKGAKIIKVKTGDEMFEAVKKNFPKCDCLIMSAAVSDYKPLRASKTKIKKGQSDLTIKLKPTKDILNWAGRSRKHQLVVGFALEDRAIRANAGKKLKDKKLDMIVANTPRAIGSEKSTVHIKTPAAKWITISNATKKTIANKIIRQIEALPGR
jgi:phosphopantothenoylcysteine decarboxylase/phosphopantothenate--cysteine ligase